MKHIETVLFLVFCFVFGTAAFVMSGSPGPRPGPTRAGAEAPIAGTVTYPPVPPSSVLIGPETGADPAPPKFRRIVPMDLPGLDAARIVSGTIDPKRLPPIVAPPAPVPTPPTRPVYSRGRIVDCRDYGLVDGGDAWPAIMAAYKAIRDRGGVEPGRSNPRWNAGAVLVPSGRYTLSRPIIHDVDYVDLIGEGDRLTELAPTEPGPGIVVERFAARWRSIPELASLPASFSADHRVDSFGILDRSAAPSPGAARGMAFKAPSNAGPWADAFVSIAGGAPATGRDDLWSNISSLTVDYAITGPDGGPPTGGALFGMGTSGKPMPLCHYIYYEPAFKRRVFAVAFATDKGGWTAPSDPPRWFTFGDPDAIKGLGRVSFQVDFTRDDPTGRCEVRGWQGGATGPLVEMEVHRWYGTRGRDDAQKEPSFSAADGLHFRTNRLLPFLIGNTSGFENTWKVRPEARTVATFHGLSLRASADYTSAPDGTQARKDGGPIDDAYRYRNAGRGTDALIARYGMEVPPWDGGSGDYGRFVWFLRGRFADAGFLGMFEYEHGDVEGPPVQSAGFRDFTLTMPNLSGDGFLVANIQDLTVDGVTVTGGAARGYAGRNVGANYTVRIANSHFTGWYSWIHAIGQILRVDRVGPGYVTRHAVVASGCDLEIGEILTGGYSNTNINPVAFYWSDYSDYAGHCAIQSTNIDEENGAATAIVVEKTAPGMDFTIGRAGVGGQSPDVPGILLIDHSPDDGQSGMGGRGFGNVSLRGLTARAGLALHVQGDWMGTIEGNDRAWTRTAGSRLIRYGDARPSVVSIHYLPDVPNALPDALGTVWQQGAHVIHRTKPPPGGWTRAICSGTGTVGGPTAPTWQTFDAMP
jgi:hypothetical protein